MTTELLNLKLTDIELGDRARLEYDINEDFLNSIREKGIIQPITVARNGSGNYRLLAGGRRYTASTQLGLDTIPCIVRTSAGELDDREIEFLENAQRKDLTWQENMDLVCKINELMKAKYGDRGSQSKTANFLDRSVGGISRVMSLAQSVAVFPKLRECSTEDEAVRKARKILEGALVKDLAKQHKAAAVESGLSDSDVDDLGRELEAATERKPGEGFKDDPYVSIARRAQSHYRIGNAFDALQEMVDNNLRPPTQIVEVDPPYGIDLKTQKKGELTRELNIYEEVPKENYSKWTEELIYLLDQTTPKDCRIIYWYGHEWYDLITRTMSSVGWEFDPIPCIWDKGTGQTNAPDHYLARTYETFIVATKGNGIPIAKRGRANVFPFHPVPASKKYHPTQKPIGLMEEILRTFGWPGGILMCPFLGSGVTLRAAYKLNMMPFGWELNESNKEPFLAALEEDIQAHKVNAGNPENPHPDIPF